MQTDSASEQTLFALMHKQVKAAPLIRVILIHLISVCTLWVQTGHKEYKWINPAAVTSLALALSLLGVSELTSSTELNQQLLALSTEVPSTHTPAHILNVSQVTVYKKTGQIFALIYHH